MKRKKKRRLAIAFVANTISANNNLQRFFFFLHAQFDFALSNSPTIYESENTIVNIRIECEKGKKKKQQHILNDGNREKKLEQKCMHTKNRRNEDQQSNE